jgi:hypothetical protein
LVPARNFLAYLPRTPPEKSYSRPNALFAFFLIRFPLASTGASRADQANIIASFSMHDNEQTSAERGADCDERLLRNRVIGIWNRDRHHVAKTVTASSKLTARLEKLERAFRQSHSNCSATDGDYFPMQTFFASVKKWSASLPPSRPTPLCFMPPNGTRKSRTSQQFTQTVPA